ncbi:hypothetical protein SDC9_176895 [bioreactor metagenome]|uniref:Uncharacterized protein n=1 Tax=bioreactor metagenome TaxID=1076179 RepID=A0A645GTY7_9ZZZZ
MGTFLREQSTALTEYDESLVRRLIEKVNVYTASADAADKLEVGSYVHTLYIDLAKDSSESRFFVFFNNKFHNCSAASDKTSFRYTTEVIPY